MMCAALCQYIWDVPLEKIYFDNNNIWIYKTIFLFVESNNERLFLRMEGSVP